MTFAKVIYLIPTAITAVSEAPATVNSDGTEDCMARRAIDFDKRGMAICV